MKPASKRTLGARLQRLLYRPVGRVSRAVLVVLTGLMVFGFFLPLWRYSMEAPQYPEGLSIDIYFHRLEGGHGGRDINEINELNHYISMRKIERSQLVELDWIPFAFGVLMLLALRAALIGNGRMLVDLSVLTVYLSGFTMSRFIYWLYSFGHDLDPHAAIKIEPFQPVIIGTKQVANFTTHSFPQVGSAFVALFGLGVIGVTAWHFWSGLRHFSPAPGRAQAPAVPAEQAPA